MTISVRDEALVGSPDRILSGDRSSRPLVIVCDWIPPAFGAVGQYELARAIAAAREGRAVTLIGLGSAAREQREIVEDGHLTIVRVPASRADKSSMLKRAIWALTANTRLIAAVMKEVKTCGRSEIKVTGSPPFLSYEILLLFTVSRRHSITYRITDFYPETAFAAGKALFLRPLTGIIHALRKRADRIEALSVCQQRRLLDSGVPERSVHIVRDKSPVSFEGVTSSLVRPFLEGDVVLLYSGNLGVAHDWTTFAEAYRRHVHFGANKVRLWLNATGVGVEGLTEFCGSHQLPIHVTPPVALSELAGVLLAADAHLILLGDAYWGYVFPSKIYGCLDSGRPCLFVGPAESEIHALLEPDPRHRSVRSGDVQAGAAALDRLGMQAG